MKLLKRSYPLAPAILSSLLFLPQVHAQETPVEPEVAETQPVVEEETPKETTVETVVETKEVKEVIAEPEVVPPVVDTEKTVVLKEEAYAETPLPAAPSLTFSPNGEVRLRGNYRVLGTETHSLTSRARVGLKGEYDTLSINVQVQDARIFGAAGVADGSFTGIHEGYFQLKGEDMWFRAGRQEIALGGQRMIGSLNWADAARAFDALRFQATLGELKLDVFGAILANQQIAESGDFGSDGDYLAGAYFTYAPAKTITIEPYLLFRHNGPTADAVNKKHNIASFGLRTTGKFTSGFGYDLEGDVQVGKRNDNDHFAFAGAGEAFYKIDASMKPKIALGFTVASGESADGKTNEFDNFFPTNHKFYGSADLFGWRNIMQGHVKFSATPTKGISANLMVAPTLLFDEDGRWSNAGGKTIGEPSGEETFLGTEIDFNAKWSPKKHFFFAGGYSIFLPGAAAEERLASTDPLHYIYLMSGVNFKTL